MKTIPTVHQLRLSGKPVEITHLRQYYKYDAKTGKKHVLLLCYEDHKDLHPDYYLDAKGGCTMVTIFENFNRENGVSVTANCSKYDAYVRKTGVKIGVGKAYRLLTSK